jgi:hypothetical protein
MKPRAAHLSLLVTALVGLACFGKQYRGDPPVAVVAGDPIVQMKPPGKLPSLESPALVPIEKHTYPPGGTEILIGTDVEGRGRAYPIGLLDDYEVVNDQTGGIPYVVARCALTEITALYDRRLNGRTLTFVNSGALWRDTLVLRDRETGTLWTAATGRALSGPLEGETLRAIPARVTTAGAWRTAFPSSLYLDTGELSSVGLPMRLYGLSPWQGVSGFETSNRRYKPKQEVFAVVLEGETLAFTAAELSRLGHTTVTLAGSPVELRWDAALLTPRAFACDEELAVTPMYWFAADRHFAAVRTLEEATAR